MWWLMAGLLQGAVPPANPVQPTPSVITNPDWQSLPSAKDMANYFPASAARNGIDGKATIECQVNSGGLLVECTVLDEAPVGENFGAAAITISTKFRMRPATRDGKPVDGGLVRIPIRFVLPNGPPRPAPTFESAKRCYPLAADRLETGPTAMAAKAAYFAWRMVLEVKFLSLGFRPSEIDAQLVSLRQNTPSSTTQPSPATVSDQCDEHVSDAVSSFGKILEGGALIE